MKHNKNGFTLIELLAVIVILALLVGVGIISITRYLSNARRGAFVTTANAAIEAVRTDFQKNGYTKSAYYDITEANKLMEKKLKDSPYKGIYSGYIVAVVDGKDVNYGICLEDGKGNIIKPSTDKTYTVEKELINNNVLNDSKLSCETKNLTYDKAIITATGTVFTDNTSSSESGNTSEGGSNNYIKSPDSCFTTETVTGGVKIKDFDYSACGSEVGIPDKIGDSPVIGISNLAFWCKGEITVHIPDSVTTIGDKAFYGKDCTTAGTTPTILKEKIVLSKNVATIGTNAFSNLSANSVDISKASGIISIGERAFQNTPIGNLVLPETVTYVGQYAFFNAGIGSVDLSKATSLTYTSNYMLSSNQITSINIPSNITVVGTGTFNNNKIKTLNIPGTVKTIGTSAFSNNEITTLNLSEGLTSISPNAFSLNDLTGTVIIPSTVKTIYNDAFKKASDSNIAMTKIINKPGLVFDWGLIINNKSVSTYKNSSCTVSNTLGNVVISLS